MNRIRVLLEQAIEAYAAHDHARAVQLAESVLEQDPGHARGHIYRALASLEGLLRELKTHFTQLTVLSAGLQGNGISQPARRKHIETARRIWGDVYPRADAFVSSMARALEVDPALYHEFPPALADDYRMHWDEGIGKCLTALVDVVEKLDGKSGARLRGSFGKLEQHFHTLVSRIANPPENLPEPPGEMTGMVPIPGHDEGGVLHTGTTPTVSHSGDDAFSFDLDTVAPLDFGDESADLELVNLDSDESNAQMPIDSAVMLVRYTGEAAPPVRFRLDGTALTDAGDSSAELDGPSVEEVAEQAAIRAAERMLEQERARIEAERQRSEAELAEARKQLQAAEAQSSHEAQAAKADRDRAERELLEARKQMELAEQRAREEAARAEQGRLEAEAKARDDIERVRAAQRQSEDAARAELERIKAEAEAARREAEQAQREALERAAALPSADDFAALAERIARQIVEQHAKQQKASGKQTTELSPDEVARKVALTMAQHGAVKGDDESLHTVTQVVRSRLPQDIAGALGIDTSKAKTGGRKKAKKSKKAGGKKKAAKRKASKKAATAPSTDDAADTPESTGAVTPLPPDLTNDAALTRLSHTMDHDPAALTINLDGAGADTAGAPPSPADVAAMRRAVGQAASAPAASAAPAATLAEATPAPRTAAGAVMTAAPARTLAPARTGPPLQFEDGERAIPLDAPEGEAALKRLRAAYEHWVRNRPAHPFPQAPRVLHPLGVRRTTVYGFQLVILFETRQLGQGSAEHRAEAIPDEPLLAGDVNPWACQAELPLDFLQHLATYRLPGSFHRLDDPGGNGSGNGKLGFVELRVQRTPRVDLLVYPREGMPERFELLDLFTRQRVMRREVFEPFMKGADMQRLFPEALHGTLRELAGQLRAAESKETKIRGLSVAVRELTVWRMNYRLPGAPDYRPTKKGGTQVIGRKAEDRITEESGPGRTFECAFVELQPEDGEPELRVVPEQDVAVDYEQHLLQQAQWAAGHGRADQTQRLTRTLLSLDPAARAAWKLQQLIRGRARLDYVAGFAAGLALAVAVLMLFLHPRQGALLAVAPLLLVAGGLVTFALWTVVGMRLGSRLGRFLLATLMVAGACIFAPLGLQPLTKVDWWEPEQLFEVVPGTDSDPDSPAAAP